MGNLFKHYAEYYDLLYVNKEYTQEIEYILKLIEKYSSIEVSNILDIGCGTGNHALALAKKGYKVIGIDQSQKMIEIAQKQAFEHNNVVFHLADSSSFNTNERFDAAISLFHVFSYLVSNEILSKTFLNINRHLKDGALFLFDFWYGPAVLHDLPETRLKIVENDDIKVFRTAEPLLLHRENTVKINYELNIIDKKSLMMDIIKETHSMRYLFLPELKLFAYEAGFDVLADLEWMNTTNGLNRENWYGLMVLKKNNLK